MYSYRDQLELLKDIRLKNGQEHRGNCPFCGGRNTFTLTRRNDDLVWNCFKASCGVRGSKQGKPSLSTIASKLDALRIDLEARTGPSKPFPDIPHMVSLNGRPEALEWLSSYHALEAYERDLVTIRYAPEYDRISFLSYDPTKYFVDAKHEVKGWTGRAIEKSFPKWMKWGDTNHIMIVGSGPRAVVVEDPLSACAVGVIDGYTGVSLLGTTLTSNHVRELRQFDELLICLDPDAYDKGLKMSIRLSGISTTRMIPIENDLKYYEKDEIERMIE